jgi:hypothetical protein
METDQILALQMNPFYCLLLDILQINSITNQTIKKYIYIFNYDQQASNFSITLGDYLCR